MAEKQPRQQVANEILERLRHVDRTLESYRHRTTTIIWLVAVLAAAQIASVVVTASLFFGRVDTLGTDMASSNTSMRNDIQAISEKLDQRDV